MTGHSWRGLFLPLPLSLFHSNTHTHTHTRTPQTSFRTPLTSHFDSHSVPSASRARLTRTRQSRCTYRMSSQCRSPRRVFYFRVPPAGRRASRQRQVMSSSILHISAHEGGGEEEKRQGGRNGEIRWGARGVEALI